MRSIKLYRELLAGIVFAYFSISEITELTRFKKVRLILWQANIHQELLFSVSLLFYQLLENHLWPKARKPAPLNIGTILPIVRVHFFINLKYMIPIFCLLLVLGFLNILSIHSFQILLILLQLFFA